MHYFGSSDSFSFTYPLLPIAAQAPAHIFLSVTDCSCRLAWNFPFKLNVDPKEVIVSTATTTVRMNMNDHDEICRASESLIKEGQPVTYGNVSQRISGCPGSGFQLLFC